MSLSFVQDHGNSNALATAWATQNLTVGSFLLAILFIQSGTSDVSGISDGTNTWTQLVPIFRNAAGFGVAVWCVQSNTLATKPTVTATLTGGSSFNSIAVLEYTGQNASALDVSADAAYASSGSAQSISVGPLMVGFTNETLIGISVANAGSANFTGDSNFTQRGSGVIPASMFVEDQAITIAGSYSFSPTQTSTGAAASSLLIALKSATSTSGSGVSTTRVQSPTPATVTNSSGYSLPITSPTLGTKLGQPVNIVFCDANGNELTVTGSTKAAASSGSPTPVVLCDSTGHPLAAPFVFTSNGNSITVSATLTGVKLGQPIPVVPTDPNGLVFNLSGFTLGAMAGNPTPIVLTDVNGNVLTLSGVAT